MNGDCEGAKNYESGTNEQEPKTLAQHNEAVERVRAATLRRKGFHGVAVLSDLWDVLAAYDAMKADRDKLYRELEDAVRTARGET